MDKFRFVVDGTTIPSITEKLVTSLGKTFDCSLRDTASIQATIGKLGTWLSAVEKSGLPGRLKAWLYQRGILPRVLWPLLVYEVTMSRPWRERSAPTSEDGWVCHAVLRAQHCTAGTTNSSFPSAALRRNSGSLVQERHWFTEIPMMPEWHQQTSWFGQEGSSKLKRDWSWWSPDWDIWLWCARWKSDEQGWVPSHSHYMTGPRARGDKILSWRKCGQVLRT